MDARRCDGWRGRFVVVVVVVAMLVSVNGVSGASLDSAGASTSSLVQQIAPAGTPAPSLVRLANGQLAAANQIIVRFRAGVTTAEQAAVHQGVGRASALAFTPRVRSQISPLTQTVEITGFASVEAAVQAYGADSRVEEAVPDYANFLLETPNDPSFSQQYGMTKVNAPAAWDVTHSSSAIKIAILDCGVHVTHPDLTGKVVLSKDIAGNDNTPRSYGTDDICNHGTHVAGIAAASTNNGVGVAGVGYNASLLNGNVFHYDSTYGAYLAYDSDIDNGIRWATDNGAKVINMSLGQEDVSCTQQSAVDYAWAAGVVIVAAAGNGARSVAASPANCTHVVSVASTGTTDALSYFSDHGTGVTIAAPGENIYSTLNPDVNGGTAYGNDTGTSMSSPHVAGAAALVWATGYGTSAQAVVDRLCNTADHVAGTGTSFQCGRLNVGSAVAPLGLYAVMPAVGGTSGNSTVTLTGAGYGGAMQVTFGGVSATNVTVVNATTIRVNLPPHAAGAVDVVVSTASGSSFTKSGGFTYVTPNVAPTPASTATRSGTPSAVEATHPVPTPAMMAPTPKPQPMRR